jgi:hypothetical protein
MGCGTFSAVVYVEERCGGPSLPAKSNKEINKKAHVK